MTDESAPDPAPAPAPAPPAPAAAPAPSHLVLLEDAEGFSRGAVAPNDPELARRLSARARPATAFDLGVAGIVTRSN